MRDVKLGTTDYTVLVKINATDGSPLTGLTEASIDLAYSRVETDNDVTTSDVTPAALSALTDAHTDWGFEEVSATDHPGLYRLDIADAVFASGAWEAVVTITDASGTDFYAVDIGFRLVAFDPTDGVRLGLTGLANAVPGASGGLVIAGTNAPISFVGSGSAMTLFSTGANGNALAMLADGTGAGIYAAGGATGNAVRLFGGGTSGDAILATATDGDGADIRGGGTSGHGMRLARGGTSGDDLALANNDFIVYDQLLLRAPHKIWFVATTGNDSNAGTQEAPFLTIGAAVTAARSGDTIFVKTGTYTETVDIDTANKYALTIIGESRKDTIITNTVASYGAVLKLEHGSTIRNLTVQTATTDGTGISGTFEKHDITLDRVTCTGQWDGVLNAYGTYNPRGMRVTGCYFEATFDAANFGGAKNFLVEDSYFKTTGEYGSVSYNTSACRMTVDQTTGTFRNCTFEVAHAATHAGTTKHGSCVVMKGDDSHVTFERCNFKARKSSATDHGNVYVIRTDESSAGEYHAVFKDCTFDVATSGDGTAYEVDASTSGTTVLIDNCWYDIAKCTGATNISTDVRPEVAGREIELSANGEVTATLGTAVSAFNVDNSHTWKFDSPTQTTANNILQEFIGFIGLVAMDFTEPMPAKVVIQTVDSATFANISGTEPTVTTSAVSANKKRANITINTASATAGTYTISVTVTTTDSQTFVRKGRITIA